jgi:hypothetical protein
MDGTEKDIYRWTALKRIYRRMALKRIYGWMALKRIYRWMVRLVEIWMKSTVDDGYRYEWTALKSTVGKYKYSR